MNLKNIKRLNLMKRSDQTKRFSIKTPIIMRNLLRFPLPSKIQEMPDRHTEVLPEESEAYVISTTSFLNPSGQGLSFLFNNGNCNIHYIGHCRTCKNMASYISEKIVRVKIFQVSPGICIH